jgi:hypothetical protein
MTTPLVSLVLPCRNQADHIGAVLARYVEPLETFGWPFELVVVPNGSRDDTGEVVRRLARSDSRLRVVSNPQGGWGLSVRMGLEAARGDVLAYTNTARTDPESIPTYLRQWAEAGPCLVKARREARNAPLREIGSALYNFEARLLFGIRCRDVNGTPKVFGRTFYEAAPLRESGDLVDLELMTWAVRHGLPIREVSVRGFQRHGGKSSTTLKTAFKLYAGALRLRFRRAA